MKTADELAAEQAARDAARGITIDAPSDEAGTIPAPGGGAPVQRPATEIVQPEALDVDAIAQAAVDAVATGEPAPKPGMEGSDFLRLGDEREDGTRIAVGGTQTSSKGPRRPQSPKANAAAALGRRAAQAELQTLTARLAAQQTELDALKRGATSPGTPSTAVAREAGGLEDDPRDIVDSTSIPDTHPGLAGVLAEIKKLGARPKQDDFPDIESYEAAVHTWEKADIRLDNRLERAREGVAARETASRRAARVSVTQRVNAYNASLDRARSRHADFASVLSAADSAGMALSAPLRNVLGASPEGGELLYQLAKDPAAVARLNVLTEGEVGLELGTMQANLKLLEQTPRPQANRGARVTSAPDPIRADITSRGVAHELELDDPELSQAEYKQRREAARKAQGLNPH